MYNGERLSVCGVKKEIWLAGFKRLNAPRYPGDPPRYPGEPPSWGDPPRYPGDPPRYPGEPPSWGDPPG